MQTRQALTRSRFNRSACGRVLLLVCFVWSGLGMSLPQKAVDHPNCPCGCQGEGSCGGDQPAEPAASKAGCCSPSAGCCAKKSDKVPPTKASCCQQQQTSSNDPVWQALCRCGEKIGHYVVIAVKYKHRSAADNLLESLISERLLPAAVVYESRSEAPCPPPPRNRQLTAIS